MGPLNWNINNSGQGSVVYMQLTAVLDVAQEDVVVLATVAAGAVVVEAKDEETMQASSTVLISVTQRETSQVRSGMHSEIVEPLSCSCEVERVDEAIII
jgi:phage tail sheath gpL-like